MNAFEKLTGILNKTRSYLCVGLDSEFAKLPPNLRKNPHGIFEFNRRIIEATSDFASAYKINFAFYEEFGSAGFDILHKTIDLIPENIFTIGDAKRGDIGNTSRLYAKSVFEYFRLDSITVSPYMGFDSISPFLEYTDKMVFVLALTSNKGSADFQRLESEGKPLFIHVIEKAKSWTNSNNLGFVAGATHPDEISLIRQYAPSEPLLIPGIGTQGGDVEGVLAAIEGTPALINVSRDIIFTSQDYNFDEKAREKAIYYNKLLEYKAP
jgi:orotidine-5'-phosphate decarboxylase